MQPRMSAKEQDLFTAFLRHADHYVEFGTGGSTYVASSLVKRSILSLDSSQDWIDKVKAACGETKVDLRMLHIDIGPIGDWGCPLDPDTKDSWPAYHQDIWRTKGSRTADLYMIDGRFRVACFAQTVLHCSPNALICFHDFASREYYHCVRGIAREVASAEDLSVFRPIAKAKDMARTLLEQHKYDRQ